MYQSELNELPEMIASGKISKKVALDKLAIYLRENYGVFGLQKKDEDFKSEVIILLLEKGEKILDQFNPDYGTFFTYFFCFIKSLMNNVTRKRAASYVQENHGITESISNYQQMQDAYAQINYQDFEIGKVPYSYKPISPETLQLACKTETYHIKEYLSKKEEEYSELQKNLGKISPSMAERILLVLALKSAYYITDTQINKIAEICHIEKEHFQEVIQQIKIDLMKKHGNKENIEKRRNKAYYLHFKYKSRLELDLENVKELNNYEIKDLTSKYKKQTFSWKRINDQLEKGVVNIRPTNKTIAQILGICERQVSFYIKNAKLLGLTI